MVDLLGRRKATLLTKARTSLRAGGDSPLFKMKLACSLKSISDVRIICHSSVTLISLLALLMVNLKLEVYSTSVKAGVGSDPVRLIGPYAVQFFVFVMKHSLIRPLFLGKVIRPCKGIARIAVNPGTHTNVWQRAKFPRRPGC